MRMLGLVQLGGKSVILGIALMGATALVSVTADAGRPPVSVGKISSRVSKRSDVKRALETAVKSELGRVDLSGIRGPEHYVLSASLVKMETVTESDQAETTCVVSATLTRERGGALHAVLQGRARVSDRQDQVSSAELEALRAAVRSAISRVPEAIR
jgi:hypothetical protein